MAGVCVPRVDILGVGIHALNMDLAVHVLDDVLRNQQTGYVTVTDVHGIMRAQDDPGFRDILNGSLLTTPDGMPTAWIGRARGYRSMDRVYGPELMLEICRYSVRRGYTHFLYGGDTGVAKRLAQSLEREVPGLDIVGTYTPPFGPLDQDEEQALEKQIRQLQPDFFWVGLGTPKQERFMAEYSGRLEAKIMIGVGAAFDVLSGRRKDAPSWVKRSGLQWCHRLCQEPGRLWKRYLTTHPRFIYCLLLSGLGVLRLSGRAQSK